MNDLNVLIQFFFFRFNKLISLIKPFLSRSSSLLRSLHLGNATDSEVMDNVEYSEAVLRKLFEDFDFVKKGFFIKKADYSITLLGPKLTEVGRNIIKVYWPLCQGQTYIYLTRKYGQVLSICTLLVLGLVWMTGISFKFNRLVDLHYAIISHFCYKYNYVHVLK